MKLSVATNWDRNLLDALSPYPILELYGSLSKTPVGSGRPATILPGVSVDEATSHIREVHRRGWQFNYLLNSTCTGTRPNQREYVDAVVNHLDWLTELQVDCVTVANPFLLDVVKRRHPGMRVKISVFCDVDGLAKAQMYESGGADNIALSIMRNRDFVFLRAARRLLTCELTLLVNQGCLLQCPHMTHHANVNAHASSTDADQQGVHVMSCLLQCSLQKLRAPEELLRSPWIRPEDLAVYEELGYNTFKIAGREKPTEWLKRACEGYSSRHYEGNLLDIINGVSVMEGFAKRRGVPNFVAPEIDNQALDGFLAPFKNRRCWDECGHCGHCRLFAERAVNAHVQENKALLEVLDYYGKSML